MGITMPYRTSTLITASPETLQAFSPEDLKGSGTT
jgi:hypothetical protein